MDQNLESQVIREVQNGDRERFALLVRKYSGPIYHLAYRMTGSAEEADDLAQEAFILAFRAMGTFDVRKRFFPWLYTIALNAIRTRLKGKGKNPFVKESKGEDDSFPDTGAGDPEMQLIVLEEQVRVQATLRRVPVRLREAVVLRYFQDLSFQDISIVLNISVAATKQRVYRGLRKMKEIMDGTD